MLWQVIDRVVTLLTLVALVLMVAIIFNSGRSSQDLSLIENKLNQYKIENQNTRSNNINYIEKRINKLQEQQDSYQILVDRRLLIMENQIKLLVDTNRTSQKVIQTNLNNMVSSPVISINK